MIDRARAADVPVIQCVWLARTLYGIETGHCISRETLRAPFYALCYLAAVCVAFVSVGGAMFQRPELPNAVGAAIMIVGAAWFLFVQSRWFARRLNVSKVRGAVIAVLALIRALIYLLAILVPLAFI